METHRPSALMIIDHYYAHRVSAQGRVAAARSARVRVHLLEHLEEYGERILVTDSLSLLALQRELDPAHAVARIADPADLVWMLEPFVFVERLLPARLDAVAQLHFARGLLDSMAGLYERDEVSCALIGLRSALRGSKEHLDRLAAAELRGRYTRGLDPIDRRHPLDALDPVDPLPGARGEAGP